jgi:hypothetical protein
MSFDALGNFTPPSKKSPGDHWLFCQPLEELAIAMRQRDYPQMELVVRDGTGRLHKKQLEIPNIEQWLPPPPPQRTPPRSS